MGIHYGAVLGGDGLISNEAAMDIFTCEAIKLW